MWRKPASSLVVPLEEALKGILPSERGRQMAGNSYSASTLSRDRRINVPIIKKKTLAGFLNNLNNSYSASRLSRDRRINVPIIKKKP